jgi:hypothetical protein
MQIEIPRECAIPLQLARLKQAIAPSEGDAGQWLKFVAVLEAVYHHESFLFLRRMKAVFAAFHGEACTSSTDEELDAIDQQFVLDFCKMMSKGNYQMLSQEYWDLAMREDFSLLAPINVEYSKLDSGLLTKFLDKHGSSMDVLKKRPDFANRVLIFRQGFGSTSITNRFIDSKLNMLLNKLIGIDQANTAPAIAPTTQNDQVRYAERLTLQHALPTVTSIVQNFLRKITITEPTFKQLVLLFRNDDPSAPRNIHIRTYKDIPMSDIEGVFPHVQLHFR